MYPPFKKLTFFEPSFFELKCCHKKSQIELNPSWPYPSEALVRGDSIAPCVSAASIIAKVYRDKEMRDLDKIYPGYGFSSHKGYGTKEHIDAIKRLGPTPIHRKTFEPMKSIITRTL